MKLLFDFFPILLFFIVYKLYDIYIATAAIMGASVIQVATHWWRHRSFERLHIITLFLVLILGAATLFFHNALFIKWKPTAIYWAFAMVFFVTQYIGRKPIVQHLLENKIQLASEIWYRLNLMWALFFLGMGFLNLVVLYNFSTDFWVNFKLFGTLGLSFLFVILQSFYMARKIKKVY